MTLSTYLAFVAPVALVLVGLAVIGVAALIIRSGRVDEVALRAAAREQEAANHAERIGKHVASAVERPYGTLRGVLRPETAPYSTIVTPASRVAG